MAEEKKDIKEGYQPKPKTIKRGYQPQDSQNSSNYTPPQGGSATTTVKNEPKK